ncbi:MAG: hypothetical protein AVDCRST_MAG23-2635 [uncultured Sphingosinicella sp.]|uniref:TIGR02117 family protein n=1 Tax=uncultured Sphingosinicella sp. TaxID=478748 RepID=A0A6J4UEK3_9SPHN|nr:TIGR02117 family protein [uncultured Sphingosinicella sp.]CAA9547049.1 MAG: hypothetical protein AVDCRST_MAG23-2635 [uncultured Sphingosinicella sp.]
MKRMWRAAAWALGVLAALPLLYALAALIGGLIPANAGWEEPRDGVVVFVRTNGVHTWIMVPTVNAQMDWRPLAPAAHIRDPRYAGNYLALGYGNREFYLNTPRWADLRPRTALAAAFGGGRSLMHVEHEWNPRVNEDQQRLVLTPDQYRRLAGHMVRSFELDEAGRTRPLLGRGYGPADVFYEARGPYNAFLTCNEWTGAALRAAGVRTGIWTPFSQSITARL